MCNGQITQTLDFGPIEHMDQRVFRTGSRRLRRLGLCRVPRCSGVLTVHYAARTVRFLLFPRMRPQTGDQ